MILKRGNPLEYSYEPFHKSSFLNTNSFKWFDLWRTTKQLDIGETDFDSQQNGMQNSAELSTSGSQCDFIKVEIN